MKRFSEVKLIPRDQIITDPKTFQGRQVKFAQETVNKIVREGFDKSQDPIVVWYDSQKNKYVVISGHSRWEGSEILYKKGDTSLKNMPAKVFMGDKDEAIEYAVLESNRSGTEEGFKSDLKAFKLAKSKAYNHEKLLSLFKPESKLRLLQDLAFLNEDGKFLSYIGTDSEKSFPYIQRNAQWVGNLRKAFPALTNEHESEMFDYLYDTKKNILLNKQKFFDIVQKKVQSIDFDKSKPLNLKNIIAKNVVTDPARIKINQIQNEIDELVKDRSKKEELTVKAKVLGKNDLLEKFKKDIEGLNSLILRKMEQKRKLESQISTIEKQVVTDLFSQPAETPKRVVASAEKPKQYYIINSDRKAEIYIGYEFYKSLAEPLRKEIKAYFLFSRSKGAWVSKGQYDSYSVDQIVKKLNLPLEGKEQRKTFGEKQEQKIKYAENRAERYEVKAKKAEKRGEALQAEFNRLRKDWSWITQPIIRGHSGSERFGRQRQKVLDRYTKGFEEYEKSKYYLDRASTSKNTAENTKLKDPFYLTNRIKEAQKTIKKVGLWVNEYQQPTKNNELITKYGSEKVNDWIEKGIERLQEAYEKLAYYSFHLNQLKDSSIKIFDGKESLKNAEYVLIRGDWHKVISLNPTTITHSWFVGTFKHPYSEIRDAVYKGEQFKVMPGAIEGQFKIEKTLRDVPLKNEMSSGKKVLSPKQIEILAKGHELMKKAQEIQKESGTKTLTMYNMPMQMALQFAARK